MAAFATVQDVENRWRPLNSNETTVATKILDDASELVRMRVPNIDQQIDEGDLPATIVTAVVVGMVVRVLRNPDGIRQESVDGYSYTMAERYDGRLVVTPDDLELLSPGAASGAFTIALPWSSS